MSLEYSVELHNYNERSGLSVERFRKFELYSLVKRVWVISRLLFLSSSPSIYPPFFDLVFIPEYSRLRDSDWFVLDSCVCVHLPILFGPYKDGSEVKNRRVPTVLSMSLPGV